MKTGRTILATVVLVSGLAAGALQTPVAGRHVATVGGSRGGTALTSVQVATIGGSRGGTFVVGTQTA